jgi:hypothetical protein
MIWEPTKYWCWRPWFAWRPIWLAGEYKRAWLTTVERRYVGGIAGWEYRRLVQTR